MQYRLAITHQCLIFCLAGLAQLALDIMVFTGLYNNGVTIVIANTLARLAGAMLGYLMHKYATFRRVQAVGVAEASVDSFGSEMAYLLKFVVWWIVATLIGGALLSAVAHYTSGEQWVIIAKPVVELCLAIMAFFVFRHWVFVGRKVY